MVKYSYQIDEIEQNHERFIETGEISVSPEVRRSLKTYEKFQKPTNTADKQVA